MANQNQQLTVADLEAATRRIESTVNFGMAGSDDLAIAVSVLRDYVRLRKSNGELVKCLKQAIGRFKDGQFCANTKCGSLESSCSKCDAMMWRKVLAEAEKGEVK